MPGEISASPKSAAGGTHELARAARAGDGDAWEALYRAIYPRLRAFFIRRVGAEHAEDSVSETMTRAVASIHRLNLAEGGFEAWVFGIARHVSVDHHRRHQRIRRHLHLGRLLSADDVEGATPVDHDLVVEDDHAAIRSHFAELTDNEREVLELRVIAGLSAEEAGQALGRTAGAVRTAQSRALAHLRNLMERTGG
jgi:RNA polymerase sigma-70 factor (ECF subfamily)